MIVNLYSPGSTFVDDRQEVLEVEKERFTAAKAVALVAIILGILCIGFFMTGGIVG